MLIRRWLLLPGWVTCGLSSVLLFASAAAAVACPLCYEAARQMELASELVSFVPIPLKRPGSNFL